VAVEFYQNWNLPSFCSYLDEKHIQAINRHHFGLSNLNLFLLALVGAGNRFVALDASSYGKGGDAAIFIKSVLGKSIPSGTVEFPKHRLLPRMTTILLSDFRCQGIQVNKCADEAFSMEQSKLGVQKPFFIIARLNEHMKMPFIFEVSISEYLSSKSDYKNISKCHY
jgi:hypothetical protein